MHKTSILPFMPENMLRFSFAIALIVEGQSRRVGEKEYSSNYGPIFDL